MIASWMAYAVLVALALSAAAWALDRGMRSAALPLRWIWAAAIGAACLLPVWALLGSDGTVAPAAVVGAEPAQLELSSDALVEAPRPPSLAQRAAALVASAWALVPAAPALPDRLDPVAIALWATLSGLVVAGLLRAHLALRSSRRDWTAAHLDGHEVLLSDDVGPAVVGVLRPSVVLPRWAVDLPPSDRALILRHEEEHRRAGDAPLLAVALVAVALIPWNLPLWWVIRRLRLAVEMDCDRRVLRRSPELRRYALLLVEMSRRGGPRRLGALALAQPAPFLERRIRTMTDQAKPRILRTAAAILLAGVLATAAQAIQPPTEADLSELVLEHLVDGGTRSESAPPPSDPETEPARTGRVAGVVTEARTGGPLRDVQVYLVGANIGAITNQNGAFVLLNVPAGTYQLRAERIGLTSVTQQVTVQDGVAAAVNFQLEAASIGLDEIVVTGTAAGATREAVTWRALGVETGQIMGSVASADTGAPISDVQVYLVGANIGAITRQNGAFVITGVPAGTYDVRAERIGLTVGTARVSVQVGERKELRFELDHRPEGLDEIVVTGTAGSVRRSEVSAPAAPRPGTGRIVGSVTDVESGAPLADVQVVLVGANRGALTRVNGSFVMLDVPTGTYEMRIERIGLASVSRDVIVPDGAEVRVDFETGPVPLRDGAAVLLPGDAYQVRGAASIRTQVSDSRTGQPTTARIVGNVVDAETGAPVTDVQVYLVGQNLGAVSRQNGAFVMLNVPAGTYELRAEGRGVETLSRQITLSAGGVLDLDLPIRLR